MIDNSVEYRGIKVDKQALQYDKEHTDKFIDKLYQPERSKREDPHINIDEIDNLSIEEMKIRMREMEDIIIRQYIQLSSTKIVEKCLGCGALNTMET